MIAQFPITNVKTPYDPVGALVQQVDDIRTLRNLTKVGQ